MLIVFNLLIVLLGSVQGSHCPEEKKMAIFKSYPVGCLNRKLGGIIELAYKTSLFIHIHFAIESGLCIQFKICTKKKMQTTITKISQNWIMCNCNWRHGIYMWPHLCALSHSDIASRNQIIRCHQQKRLKYWSDNDNCFQHNRAGEVSVRCSTLTPWCWFPNIHLHKGRSYVVAILRTTQHPGEDFEEFNEFLLTAVFTQSHSTWSRRYHTPPYIQLDHLSKTC